MKQYIDILQYLLLQYNTIRLKKMLICCTLQYIAMFNAVIIQSLHHKNDWSSNLDHKLQFIMIYMVIPAETYISFLYYWNPYSYTVYEMSFYQNPVTYCNMAIYSNTIHNMAFTRIVSPLVANTRWLHSFVGQA